MLAKISLAAPAAALFVFSLSSGMVAASSPAEARVCRGVGYYPHQRHVCLGMSTPKPDKPKQQKK